MARAYAEMFSPRPFDLTTLPNDAGYDELIIARSIPVQSVCEHHLLPFVGVAHVGYLPGEGILGLSKLARVVELFARRTQVQERLTQQVADWLQDHVAPRGLGIVVEAEHLCMTVRGVGASGTSTVTLRTTRPAPQRCRLSSRVLHPDSRPRRHADSRQIIVFWLHEQRVQAGMNINMWDVADNIERLVQSPRPLNIDDLASPDIPLAGLT